MASCQCLTLDTSRHGALSMYRHDRNWTAADGRAQWNGESLNHWSNVLTSEFIALFDPAEIRQRNDTSSQVPRPKVSTVDTTVRFDGSYREGPG